MKKTIVVFTGAVISAESGLKTFRDSDGLWENHRIEDVATPQAWLANRKLVIDFYNERRRNVLAAKPNAAHEALALLQKKFNVHIITQNVDDFHERAGCKQVTHLHGEILKVRSSLREALQYEWKKDLNESDTCELGSQLRPHIVWFGEAVPKLDEAIHLCEQADIFIAIGTSLNVYPAASLIHYTAPEAQCFFIDPKEPDSKPPYYFTFIQAKATSGVPALVSQLME